MIGKRSSAAAEATEAALGDIAILVANAGIAAAAGPGNVAIKLSALWTIDRAWRPEVLTPFLAHAVGAFGADRCLFGSNLPVEGVMLLPVALVVRLCAALDMAGIGGRDRDAILRRTALRVYRP
jgi:predicted TIM-barrel fold metal-dependent hydrolase